MLTPETKRIRAILDGEYVRPRRDPFDISKATLYGGIAGIKLPTKAYEVHTGLVLKQTYACIMAPMVMAFAPPEKPRTPHPGPWAALKEGGLNVFVALELAANVQPLTFDRLNTLWFVIAMLRLRTGIVLRLPVLSDRPFEDVPSNTEAANLLPVETGFIPRGGPAPIALPVSELEWLRDNIAQAATLMKEPIFNRAFQTLDRAILTDSSGAAIVIAWASLETLLRPGTHQITDRVCRSLAAHLTGPGPHRDRAFASIVQSYRTRGGAAHAGDVPENAELRVALKLARDALVRSIEQRSLPDIDALLGRWQTRT